jgi:hypothetical protein
VFIVPDLVGQRSQTPSFRVAGNTPETGTWTRCRFKPANVLIEGLAAGQRTLYSFEFEFTGG